MCRMEIIITDHLLELLQGFKRDHTHQILAHPLGHSQHSSNVKPTGSSIVSMHDFI